MWPSDQGSGLEFLLVRESKRDGEVEHRQRVWLGSGVNVSGPPTPEKVAAAQLPVVPVVQSPFNLNRTSDDTQAALAPSPAARWARA